MYRFDSQVSPVAIIESTQVIGKLAVLGIQPGQHFVTFPTVPSSCSMMPKVLEVLLYDIKAKLYWISSDTHQLQLIELHHLNLEIFKSI